MADETWSWRELPILDAVVWLEGTGSTMAAEAIAAEAGIDDVHEATEGIAALVKAEYLIGHPVTGWGDPVELYIIDGATEKARRVTGQWPSADPLANLVRLLEHRIADEPDPVEKTKLQKFRDALLGMGEAIATSVLTEAMKQSMGMG